MGEYLDNAQFRAKARSGSQIHQSARDQYIFYQTVYQVDRPPLDFASVRIWVDRARSDFSVYVADNVELKWRERRRVGGELARFDGFLHAGAVGPSDCKRYLRGLIAAGALGYLKQAENLPEHPLPAIIMLDIAVFGLWPVVQAPSLPRDWMSELAELTSPRIARIVNSARDSIAAKKDVDAASFAVALSQRPYAFGVLNLLEDLSDPGGAGAVLTGMAIACNVRTKKDVLNAKTVLLWIIASSGWVGALSASDLVDEVWDWLHGQAAARASGLGPSALSLIIGDDGSADGAIDHSANISADHWNNAGGNLIHKAGKGVEIALDWFSDFH